MRQTLPLSEALHRLGDQAHLLDQNTYCGWKKKARFVDPDYGEWWTLPKYVFEGHGHTKRAHAEQGQKTSIPVEEVIERIKLSGIDAELDASTYTSIHKKARFIHKTYGEWWTLPSTVVLGHDHPEVGKQNRVATCMEKYGKAHAMPTRLAKELSGYTDLTNTTFKDFIVVGPANESHSKWIISCTMCRKQKIKTRAALNSKNNNCECTFKERGKQWGEAYRSKFIGQVHNKWTITGVGSRKSYVDCKCTCGTEKEVLLATVLSGASTNCGCSAPQSVKEEQCRYYLESVTGFKWPKRRISGVAGMRYIELDGYCEELKSAFEYDGEQHYLPLCFGSHDFPLAERQRRDIIKDEYCKSNGVKLLRIPYFTSDIEKHIDQLLKTEYES